jgi:hypothetical protein
VRAARLALACAAALALAGCGDGDGGDPSSSSRAVAPRSFFGVAPQGSLPTADLERMAQGGVGTLRIFLPWGLIDPTEADDYAFGPYDQVVLDAARNGISVLPFLYGTPPWVAQDLDGVDCAADCDQYAPHSDEALRAWSRFAGAAVDRYGPDGTVWKDNPGVPARPIRVWQIWNEQNSPTFYQPRPDPESYAKLLDAAAAQIHGADPDAQVLLGGMFGSPLGGERPAYTAWDYLRRLYEIEGPDGSFDGVAAHPYAPQIEKVKTQADLMHDEIVRAGDDASLWITEIGAASADNDVYLELGEEGQAQLLSDAFDFFLAKREDWRIESVIWYSWRDTSETICEWCGSSGLFPEHSEDPKPAWDAFVALTGGT